MNYTEFLRAIELEIDRNLFDNYELSSLELIIVINHFNDLTGSDLSIIDFLNDNSLEFIYKTFFISKL